MSISEKISEHVLLKKVEQLLRLVLANKSVLNEAEFLGKKLKINKKKIIASWLFWDTGIREYSNKIYSSKAIRLVMHLHNALPGGWHLKRQKVVLQYLKEISPKTICDIGFGTPQKYLKYFLENLKNIKIILADNEESSLEFAREIIKYWNKNWLKNIDFKIFDLNRNYPLIGSQVYIFQDSLEHAKNPTKTLNNYVKKIPQGTIFIFSFPIEIKNPIPEHNIVWKDEKEVLVWLERAGLEILKSKIIKMNKDIDIFSLKLHPNFREIVVMTKKL